MAASGSRVQFFYTLETAPGVIDATAPVFTPIRFNTSSLTRNVAQVGSDEINPKRQRPKDAQGTYSTQGEIVSELSADSFDELLAILLQSAWAANTLKVGSTEQTIAILKRHTDTGENLLYSGCRLNSLAVNAAIDARVQLTFGVIGTEAAPFTVPGDAVFEDATDTEPMVTSVGQVTEGGTQLAYATAYDFTLSNGMSPIFAIHQRPAYDVQNGVFTATGNLSAYRENGGLFAKFLNETDSTLNCTFTDGDKSLTFAFPDIGYVQADDAVPGPDAIVNQFTWSAGYDAAADTTVMITRSA